MLLLHMATSTVDSRHFDAFISYRGGPGEDFDFVHNTLLNKLREMHFNICVDSEHFIAGVCKYSLPDGVL